MRRAALLWSFLLVAAFQGILSADTPLPPPQIRDIWSGNKQYCAVLDPKFATTTVYRVQPDGRRVKQWAMHGWFRVAFLDDRGDYLVCGHDGINLLPLKVAQDEPMLRFFKRGELIGIVTLGELLQSPSSMKRTASHYLWGNCLGMDARGHFVVETVEGKKIAFDPTTGQRVKPR